MTTPPTATDSAEADTPLCPACGYDLRGATSDQCTECGLVVDHAALKVSGVPWAHRRQIGRVTAYIRTLWYVTIDSRRLRHELARPQDPRDARRFRAVNAALVAIALVGVTVLVLTKEGWESIGIGPVSPFAASSSIPGYVLDMAIPWSAGATLRPMLPLCLMGLAWEMAGAGRVLMRLKKQTVDYRSRAESVAVYAAAPLSFLLGAGASVGVLIGFERISDALSGHHFRDKAAGALVVILFAGVALLGSLLRTAQWGARAHHAGASRIAGGVALMASWLICRIFLWLGVIPWCIGLLWIVLDSVR